MSVLIEILVFLVVIIVLILVHEFGHFVVAKLSKMRVDEFGIFFPPRALTLGKIGETEYTLNWLPLGGFVKIFGEDASMEGTEIPESEKARAFGARPRILQALVLIAGVFMNALLGYILITITLVMGTIQPLTASQLLTSKDAAVAISAIQPNSPAAKAGFMVGDELYAATTTLYSNTSETSGAQYSVNINEPGGRDPNAYAQLTGLDASDTPMQFTVNRNGKILHITGTPKTSQTSATSSRPLFGFTLTSVGTIKTPISQAFKLGFQETVFIFEETLIGFGHLIGGIFTGHADLSQVAGPVGIASEVGAATAQGLASLLTLAAIISINLAIVNLIPIPALDGGRLLFVIIESVTRKPINPKVSMWMNTIGFILIILLMLVVTGHDILTLIN